MLDVFDVLPNHWPHPQHQVALLSQANAFSITQLDGKRHLTTTHIRGRLTVSLFHFFFPPSVSFFLSFWTLKLTGNVLFLAV
jgi:hypothetical protein